MAGITRNLRDRPPASYTLKIESFPELLKTNAQNYESAVFEAVGYKWKLIFYPKGNQQEGGKDHVSLYVSIENTSSLPSNWEVAVDLQMFLHNQTQNKYLTVQDGEIKRFNEKKKEWGFAQSLPLSTFNDSSNGYLVNDSCTVGIELVLIKPSPKRENLSFILNPEEGKFSWKIHNFSKLDQSVYYSDYILVYERYWRIACYPKGTQDGSGNSLSVFILGFGYLPTAAESKTYEWSKLGLRNQLTANHIMKETGGWHKIYPYLGHGFTKIISFEELYDSSKGFLVDDTIVLAVEMEVVSVTKVLSN